MKISKHDPTRGKLLWRLPAVVFALLIATTAQAAQFQIKVVDNDGNPVSGFRWLLQEDTTYAVDPTNPPPIDQQLALNFHKSHHPIAHYANNGTNTDGTVHSAGDAVKGNTDGSSLTLRNVSPGRYYLSVFPYTGYAMSGAPVTLHGNPNDPVLVTVQSHPIPTAQISVYLFHDCWPLNGAPDLPEEEQGSSVCNPAMVDFSQWRVTVEEPGGKYGQNGGPLLQNAFGDPLGTTYLQTCDVNGNNPGSGSYGCLDGNGAPIVAVLGNGELIPNADGTLIVSNLAPGKYGIIATPPTGAGWTQTSTIEGTPVIDAWVKAKEPPFFVELGLPGPHVFIGFTQERNNLGGGSATVAGRITNLHMSRPVDTTLYSGQPFPQCWIAVNDNSAGKPGENLYTRPCNGDSTFSIPNVPAGSYELKVFDKPLDVVIATQAFTVDPAGTCNGGQSCNFGDVGVFNWNNQLYTWIFNDDNQNGFWDAGEGPAGAESGPVNIRWRDGTVYQSFPTDTEGLAPFDEAFPWFNWMVAEVGFTNKKATGATVVVDAGGPIADPDNDAFPDYGRLNPQPQSENGNAPFRTETGPVLLEAFQGFLGQTNVIHWGKTDYLNYDFSGVSSGQSPIYVGENGGITGIVFNTVTRAENDPELAVGEGWEPGIPRVQVNLYADGDIDSPVLATFLPFPNGIGDIDWNGDGVYQADDDVIDDIDGDGSITLADVDNYPLGWRDGGLPGPEDIDRNNNGVFDLGDALAVTWTDSWDDSTPTGCQGQNLLTSAGIADDRCFDGLRNFNQVRPGVFDGGYAFSKYNLAHLSTASPEGAAAAAKIQAFYDYVNNSVDPGIAATLQLGLLPSDYIVEAATPPGYQTLRAEHKNVDFGDAYIPAPEALPPKCVGNPQVVPPYFAILTKDGTGTDPANNGSNLIDVAYLGNPDAAPPFAGDSLPVCDLKKVPLNGAQNAAADFFEVSDTPVAANVTGIILNDLANEFNPNSPNFGEKAAPPLVPVAFYDFNGKQVNRVYSDEFGAYNAMLPSTWNVNLPQPSGVSPNVLTACMNDPGPIPNPNNPGSTMVDPFFNPDYTQFCYTLQYMPGSTTYLDTPVLPTAAFASPVSHPVDCEVPHRTPMIRDVRNLDRPRIGPFAVAGVGDTLRIRSLNNEQVPNPEWDGVTTATRFITRNYGFGGAIGNVFLEDADGNRTDLTGSIASWSSGAINVDIPAGVAEGEYELIVNRVAGVAGTGAESEIGVTVTIGHENASAPNGIQGTRPNLQPYNVFTVGAQGAYDFHTIQEAIDSNLVEGGDLLLVRPGEYSELVVMWKPVKLQGWGAGSVTLNARQVPTNKVQDWRAKVAELTDGNLANGEISLLPGQNPGAAGVFQALGAALFPTEEGAGIFVAGIDTKTPNHQGGSNRFNIPSNRGARIDGFHIVGASQGGGIVVNGYAPYTNIGNNRLDANSGFYNGGIRIGHPELTVEDPVTGLTYTDAVNDRIRVHHNQVIKNGAIGETGFGGGLALYTGADAYQVDHNWICGNFTQGSGGGIAHVGLSNGGHIEHNDILFNESFAQASAAHGGGIYIAGQTPLQPHADTGLLLSDGSGNVIINANRINGNLAGAGDGGGIAIVNANGVDIADNLADNTAWYDIGVYNNIVTNNVTGLAGAISIQNAVETHLVNNTVAHNDSTATTALAFTPGYPNQSNPLPAGIVSRTHSASLGVLLQEPGIDIPTNGGDLESYQTFSDANVINNIVFGNRSFFWLNYDNPATAIIETGLFPANCTTAPSGCSLTNPEDFSDDIAVLDGVVNTGDVMFARFNLLTDNADNLAEYTGASNVFTLDPKFANSVFNEGNDGVNIPEFTTLQTAGAFDEGGNFIQVAFGPLTTVELGSNPNQRVFYDYHILGSSPAVSAGQNVGLGNPPGTGILARDFDGDPRNNNSTNEIGADELPGVVTQANNGALGND